MIKIQKQQTVVVALLVRRFVLSNAFRWMLIMRDFGILK